MLKCQHFSLPVLVHCHVITPAAAAGCHGQADEEGIPGAWTHDLSFSWKNGILDVTLLTENPTARVRNKERKWPEVEDAKIVELFWARNEDAIKETDAIYGRRLNALARNILQSREDAEESVNDTYMETAGCNTISS